LHLFFANCHAFKEEMLRVIDSNPGLSYMIIDATGISNMDLSGLKALEELEEEAKKKDVVLLLANVHGPLRTKAEAAGLLDKVGRDSFKTVEDVYASRERVLAPSSEPAEKNVVATAKVLLTDL